MNYQIFDKDTGIYHNISIGVEDFEVEEIWGKWKPIEDEESTEIEIKDYWDIKQRAGAELRKNKVKIFEGVYYTEYQKYSFLVNFINGKVYHFSNRIYKLEVRGQEIYLQRIGSKNRVCVYKNGIFCQTKRCWLIESSQSLSKNKCNGIRICSDLYGKIEIKNHHIIASMFIGQDAIELTMAGNVEFEINHRNLENDDNRPENLEIVTGLQNKEHYRILKRFIENKLEKKLKELGVVYYTIKKN